MYGISYPRREVRENLLPLFRPAVSGGGFNIGLLHANVGCNPNHDSYSPCSVADLEGARIDYWALGHVHTRQVLRDQGPTVVYPGNPQGRHPFETGVRRGYLVEVDDSGAPQLEFHTVDVVRWEIVSVDIAGLETEQALIDAISNRVESVLAESDGRPVVFRLALPGGVRCTAGCAATGLRMTCWSRLTNAPPILTLGLGASGFGWTPHRLWTGRRWPSAKISLATWRASVRSCGKAPKPWSRVGAITGEL